MYTRRKTRVGVVTSDKMQKTVVVAVESHKRHPLYNKTTRRTTRYKVHDEKELAKLGDIVRIVESRPMSREKRWQLAEVVTRREVAEIAPREIDAAMLGISRPHTEQKADVGEDLSPPAAAEEAEAPVEAVEAPAAEETEMPVETVEEETSPAESKPEVEAEAEPVAKQEEEQAKE
jgi:small subunit ribosomal protein S17